MAFSRVGWFKNACEWVTREVKRTTGQTVVDVASVSANDGGCVLRAESETGEKFYMKAGYPEENSEVFVLQALGEVMGDVFDSPLATDTKSGFLLMTDYGKLLSQEECSLESGPETYGYVQREWAERQRRPIEVLDELELQGVPMCGPQWVREAMEEMSSDPEWYSVQMDLVPETGDGEYKLGHEEYKRSNMEQYGVCGAVAQEGL